MRVKPIKKYGNIGYPTQNEICHNELLVTPICKRWNNKVMQTSLLAATLMMTISGCTKEELEAPVSQKGSGQHYQITEQTSEEKTDLESKREMIVSQKLMLMPRAIIQPYELTEEEAWDIICEEAKEAGLDLERDNLTIDNIKLKLDDYEDLIGLFCKEDKKQLKKEHSLIIDGYDKTKKVGIEYIAPAQDLSKKDLQLEELIYVYPMTELVNDWLKQSDSDKHIKLITAEKMEKDMCAEALRHDLQEFFTELRKEGVIK